MEVTASARGPLSQRGAFAALLLVLLLAVVLRAAWLTAFNVDPGDGREDDSRFYHGVAQALSDGRGYDDPATGQTTAQWPPAYPATLAIAYAVPGDNLLTGKAVNVGLALASIVLVYLLAGRLFGRRAGLLAALLLAVFPSYVFLSTLVFSENLFVPAVLLVVTLVAWWGLSGAAPTALQSLIVGAAIGFTAMVRAEGIWLVAPVGIAWLLASRRWQPALRNALFLAAGVAVLLTPWTVRNAIQLDEYTPLRSASTGILNVGLNPEYRRYGPIPPAVPLPTIAEDLRYYSERPWRWLGFFRDKAQDLYDNDSALLFHIDLDGYQRWHGTADGVYFGLGIVALVGLGILGMAGDRGGLFLGGVLLTWTAGMALIVPEPRYHTALLPLLAVLAAVAIDRAPHALDASGGAARRLLRLAPLAALAAGAALTATTIGLTRGDQVDIPFQGPVAFDVPAGGTVTLGALEVTVRDFAIGPPDVDLGNVPPGSVQVRIDVLVRNAGLADVVVFEAQATVEDGTGASYSPIGRLNEEQSLTGDLPPGGVLKSSLVYAVPAGANDLAFVYTPLGVGVQGRWPLE